MALTKVQIDGVEFSDSTDLNVDNGTLFVDSTNNRVGVGTTSPSQKLHISGGTDDRIVVSGSGSSGLLFNNTSGTSLFQIVYDDAATNDCFITTSDDLVFRNQSGTQGGTITERMRIDSSGRVGIGTSSPSVNLDISPSSGAAEVRIAGAEGQEASIRLYADDGDDAADIKRLLTDTSGNFKIQHYSGVSFVDSLVIDSSGNVGIGTTSPSQLLELNSTNASGGVGLNITNQGDGGTTTTPYAFINARLNPTRNGGEIRFGREANYGSAADADSYMAFYTAANDVNNERARIDSSGRLLVGTTTTSNDCSVVLRGRSGDINGNAILRLERNVTSPADGDTLGNLSFGSTGTSSTNAGAWIIAGRDGGTWTNGSSHPSRLVFSTTADGASSPTERMRITSAGILYSSPTYNNTTSDSANVFVSASGQFYRSTSSIKYKTDVEELQDSYADAILSVRPVWYRSLTSDANPDFSYWGFIAEEVAAIDPRLVHWKTIEVTYDEKGSAVETPCDPEPEGVAYDRFVPHLLNLIKRQQQAIETLEAKVAALEAN